MLLKIKMATSPEATACEGLSPLSPARKAFFRSDGAAGPVGGLLGPTFDSTVVSVLQLAEGHGLSEKHRDVRTAVDTLAVMKALERIRHADPDLWGPMYESAASCVGHLAGAPEIKAKAAAGSARWRGVGFLLDGMWEDLNLKMDKDRQAVSGC